MSVTSTAFLVGRILEAANLALSVTAKLNEVSAEIAKAHAEGRTLTDEEVDRHLAATQSAIDALKAI